MSMTKYDCARNAIGDILDRVSISEKDEGRLYECIDVMYDDIQLIDHELNKCDQCEKLFTKKQCEDGALNEDGDPINGFKLLCETCY